MRIRTIVVSALEPDYLPLARQLATTLKATYARAQVLVLEESAHNPVLARPDVVIVLMGPQWLPALQTPVGAAFRYWFVTQLARSDLLILPTLLGTLMPSANALPADVSRLAYVNAVSLDIGHSSLDVRPVSAALRVYRRQVDAAKRNQGNFTSFQVFSIVPLVGFIVAGIATSLSSKSSVSQLTATENLTEAALSAFFVLAAIGVWLASVATAFVSHRPRWAVVNLLLFPVSVVGFVASAVVDSVLPRSLHGLDLAFAVVCLIGMIFAAFFLPIVFALTLPPYRFRLRRK